MITDSSHLNVMSVNNKSFCRSIMYINKITMQIKNDYICVSEITYNPKDNMKKSKYLTKMNI